MRFKQQWCVLLLVSGICLASPIPIVWKVVVTGTAILDHEREVQWWRWPKRKVIWTRKKCWTAELPDQPKTCRLYMEKNRQSISGRSYCYLVSIRAARPIYQALYQVLGCKKYNQSDFGVDHLVMSKCRVFSCVVGRQCLLWPVRSLGRTLLAFALLHSVLQGQICLLLQVFLNFLLLHSSPL